MTRAVWIIAAGCWLVALGCSEPAPPQPTPSPAAVAELLTHYDPQYDADARMLRQPLRSPGYHSGLPSGSDVHPTRKSLIYALALLERDEAEDATRAAAIIARVVALQDDDPSSPTFGLWPWYAEEPLSEMSEPDLNWADFCGSLLAQILVVHPQHLSARLRESMKEALGRAARVIRQRDVGSAYTNVAIVGGSVCVAAGEVLDDPPLLDYGRRRLQQVVQHVAQHGGFAEYNSPNYTRVAIAECERALQIVEDQATREAAESLRRGLWQMLAESFHPPTQQLAGPHSRSSSDYLRPREIAFLRQRIEVAIDPHPTVSGDSGPDVYAVLANRPCPPELAAMFHSKPDTPQEIRRTFLKSRTPSQSIVGTTWMDTDSCLGSVNQSEFWTQRRPLLAYWRTAQDPAAVFRLRFLHDGQDFASMGVRTEQAANRVVCVLHPLAERGSWHRTLDRPADGVFRAEDFRARFELRARDSRAEALGAHRYALIAGGHRAVIHVPPGRFAGREIEWRLGSKGDRVFLDAICHAGERQPFDFDEPFEVVLAAAVELLPVGQPASDALPRISTESAGAIEVVWRGGDGPPLHARTEPTSRPPIERVATPRGR